MTHVVLRRRTAAAPGARWTRTRFVRACRRASSTVPAWSGAKAWRNGWHCTRSRASWASVAQRLSRPRKPAGRCRRTRQAMRHCRLRIPATMRRPQPRLPQPCRSTTTPLRHRAGSRHLPGAALPVQVPAPVMPVRLMVPITTRQSPSHYTRHTINPLHQTRRHGPPRRWRQIQARPRPRTRRRHRIPPRQRRPRHLQAPGMPRPSQRPPQASRCTTRRWSTPACGGAWPPAFSIA